MKRHFALLGLFCGLTTALFGQDFAIDWFTVDGGGGVSRGGAFELQSTIGQPEAGASPLVGGGYVLWGGFWPGLITASTGGKTPVLVLHLEGNRAVLSWSPATPGFVLQQTDDLAQPEWESAPVGNPLELPLPLQGTTRFYRLAAP